MGTRSLTIVKDEGDTLMVMYRQMDGYPGGHGAELAEFLRGMHIVNGISLAEERRIANGMGCLAAQIVARFKDGPGGIYIENPNRAIGSGWEEYVYFVGQKGDRPEISCCEVEPGGLRVLSKGTPEEFLEWVGSRKRE